MDWIQFVRHLCWQLVVVTEYLFTAVASMVSRRIYIHPWVWGCNQITMQLLLLLVASAVLLLNTGWHWGSDQRCKGFTGCVQ